MKAPASPSGSRQLHPVEQPQQPIGGIGDVVLARRPVMQSALGDVKKLRTAGQIQAQVAVHGPEGLSKLGAGVRVVASVALTILN